MATYRAVLQHAGHGVDQCGLCRIEVRPAGREQRARGQGHGEDTAFGVLLDFDDGQRLAKLGLQVAEESRRHDAGLAVERDSHLASRARPRALKGF